MTEPAPRGGKGALRPGFQERGFKLRWPTGNNRLDNRADDMTIGIAAAESGPAPCRHFGSSRFRSRNLFEAAHAELPGGLRAGGRRQRHVAPARTSSTPVS